MQDGLPGDGLDGAVELEAGADAAGQRLDQWLTAQLGPEISRSRVQALIRQGAVSIAGKPVVVAKTDRAHKALSEAFADHGRTGDLERAYLALVWGIPQRPTGTIDAALGRAADRVRRAVVPEGRDDARHAVTHFSVVEHFGEG